MFIFGQGTDTPDAATLQRRRQMVEQLQQSSQNRMPQTFGEGLTAIGQALAGRIQDKRLTEKEDRERQRVSGQFGDITQGLLGGQQTGQPQGQPRGQQQPPASFATPAPGDLNFPSSLIQSESGGNWQARNDVMGAGGQPGHFGRLQFGHARLQDAARAGVIPEGVAPEQFMSDPEMQQAVERWHFSDIDRAIQSAGIDQMIGQEINGEPVTMDGLRAVAHLGGTGGMQRFVSTRGQYDPADANGTRLSDYFRMHGAGGQQQGAPQAPQGQPQPGMQGQPGMGGAPQQGMDPAIMQLAELAANPYLPPGQQAIAQSLIQQQMQNMDPMRRLQMEKMHLELEQARNPQAQAPAGFQSLQLRADAANLQPGTPEYQDFMAQGGRTAQDPAAQQRIDRLTENLMATGDFMDPQEAQNMATGIADGRLKSDRHPVTGELQVVDMATGQILYGRGADQEQVEPDGGAPSVMPEDIDYRGGMGVEGFGSRIANTISEIAGSGLVAPENERAMQALSDLGTRTMIDLADSVAGRPSNFLLELLQDRTVKPGSPFQGPGRSRERLQMTRDVIDRGVQENMRVMQSEVNPQMRSQAQLNIEKLSALRNDYDVVLDNMKEPEGGGAIPESVLNSPDLKRHADGAGVTVEDMWRVMTPEQREKYSQ